MSALGSGEAAIWKLIRRSMMSSARAVACHARLATTAVSINRVTVLAPDSTTRARPDEYSVGSLINDFHSIYLLQCFKPIANCRWPHRACKSSLLQRRGYDDVCCGVAIDDSHHLLQGFAHELQRTAAP